MKFLTAVFFIFTFFQCKNEKVIIGTKKNNLVFCNKIENSIDSIFKDYAEKYYIDRSVLEPYNLISIDCKQVNILLADVLYKDQEIRNDGNGDMYVIDSTNTVKVVSILSKCQKLDIKDFNKNSELAIFLVFQHATDNDLRAYYYSLIKSFSKDKLDRSFLALYTDRFLVHQRKKQIFGTQINLTLGKIDDLKYPKNINKLRECMGLLSLKEYIKYANKKGSNIH